MMLAARKMKNVLKYHKISDSFLFSEVHLG